MKKFNHPAPPRVPMSQPTLSFLQGWAQDMFQWGSALVGKLQSVTISTADIPAFQNTIAPANELSYLQVSSNGQTITSRTASQVISDIGIPAPAAGNELDMIRVNAGGTAYEARTPAQVLTDIGGAALAGSSSQQFSVQDATTSHQAVAYDQVHNIAPLTASHSSGSVTTLSATTASLTAPCNGNAVIVANGVVGAALNNVALSASLASLTQSQTEGINPTAFGVGFLTMTAAQASTFTFTLGTTGSTNIAMTILVFFVPAP